MTNIQEQIKKYVSSQPEAKSGDMEALHQRILRLMPDCRLWFIDGKDDKGKVVSNPQIGYGFRRIKYANGKTMDFYQIGISASTTGISVYIMGVEDKKHLPETYNKTIGKANVTSYCIKFKTLEDINIDVLEAAIRYGITRTP